MDKDNKTPLRIACMNVACVPKFNIEKHCSPLKVFCPYVSVPGNMWKDHCGLSIEKALHCDIEQASKCWEKYFKNVANISDGWDVVKELYLSFKNMQGQNAMTLTITEQLKNKLKQAGIEVDNNG